MVKVTCQYCGLVTIPASLPKHLRISHNKTVQDNLLKKLGMTEEQIPICPICHTSHVSCNVHSFNNICEDPNCKKVLKHRNKSSALSARHAEAVKNGTHNFQSKNLKIDENGKSLLHSLAARHAVESGNCMLLSKNRPRDEEGKDLLAKRITEIQLSSDTFFGGNEKRSENQRELEKKRIENGTHPWLHENLKLDENGKSVIHTLAAKTAVKNGTHPWVKQWNGHIQHPEDLNREFITHAFIKNNHFDLNISLVKKNALNNYFKLASS